MPRKEKVTKIIDGDTFETASRKNPVRLANVDAPEKGEPGSAKATEALSKLIEGEEVRIDTVSRDKYGRAVANVYKGRESVNKKMQKKLKQ
jgi:endonuclease YncB( thermonuclease family)